MPMTMQNLRQQLSAIEPDERTYTGIGQEEVSLLQQLLDDDEAWLAARATYALSRINTAEAHAALLEAARNPRSEIRVAVVASAANLPPHISDTLLQELLDDSSIGVRKFAIKSVSERNSLRIRSKLMEIAATADDPAIRIVAQEKIQALQP